MERKIIVAIGTDCPHKRDNNLGLYCRLGTRKLKRIKKKGKEIIVCLDCDEPGTKRVTITPRGSKKDG